MQEIGVFLMTLIAAAPNTPAEPTVEAINAIMDIYADADFDYDGPVFVNCGFLAHLQKALPNVRTMVSNRLIFCFFDLPNFKSSVIFPLLVSFQLLLHVGFS